MKKNSFAVRCKVARLSPTSGTDLTWHLGALHSVSAMLESPGWDARGLGWQVERIGSPSLEAHADYRIAFRTFPRDSTTPVMIRLAPGELLQLSEIRQLAAALLAAVDAITPAPHAA